MGGGGKFEPRELLCSNRIHEGRIVSTNKEYSTPSPGVSKIVTVGRRGHDPEREEDSACCVRVHATRPKSLDWHSPVVR